MTTKPTILELAEQLDKTLIAHNEADKGTIAAYHSEDQQKNDALHGEMENLEKVERALRRSICAARATTHDEAIVQAIIASHLIRLVAEGHRRKHARHAFAGLLSAISVLIGSERPIAATVRRRYFDVPAKQFLQIAGDAA
jgi:hypothetical protein